MGEINYCCCGKAEWEEYYNGPVRDGDFGKTIDGIVLKCGNCGIIRLDESLCMNLSDYEGEAYRDSLNQSHDVEEYLSVHSDRIDFVMANMPPTSPDGKVVADIGAAGGGYLDRMKEIVADCIAIEPNDLFRKSLIERGYTVFASAADAASEYENTVDLALSCEVIEHVADPREFLCDIAALLKPEGQIMMTTPNTDDIMLHMAPDIFSPFYFRTQHRWYFTVDTLTNLATDCGFDIELVFSSHFYGISNTMNWLRHQRPMGNERIPGIDESIDKFWRDWVSETGQGGSLVLHGWKSK